MKTEVTHLFASALNIFPEMGVSLEIFRKYSILPGIPARGLGEIFERGGQNTPLTGAGAYQYAVRVEHKDRADFEDEISIQWNRTIEITDYNTLEVVPPKDDYWVVFLHLIDANVIGRDIMTDPDRKKALDFFINTGNVTYTSPVISTIRGGIISFTKFFEIVKTPLGRTGVVGVFTPFLVRLEVTQLFDFLAGGNNGRRLTLEQVQEGVKTLVYNSEGSADDFIYEGVIEVNEQTHFIVKVYDHKNYDNTEPTLFFMGIGILVATVMAMWEFFKSRTDICSKV